MTFKYFKIYHENNLILRKLKNHYTQLFKKKDFHKDRLY